MTGHDAIQGTTAGRSTIAMIDATGWGVFFIWIAVALVANVGWGVALVGVGAVALGVQLVRRLSALPVDRWSVGVGGCLFAAGLLNWLDLSSGSAALTAWVVPAALVIVGVSIIISAWTRKNA